MTTASPKLELRIPPNMLAELKQRAEAKGTTTSKYVRDLLARHLKQPKPDMPEGARPKKV